MVKTDLCVCLLAFPYNEVMAAVVLSRFYIISEKISLGRNLKCWPGLISQVLEYRINPMQ
jgi:hypothetical protein